MGSRKSKLRGARILSGEDAGLSSSEQPADGALARPPDRQETAGAAVPPHATLSLANLPPPCRFRASVTRLHGAVGGLSLDRGSAGSFLCRPVSAGTRGA